MKWTIALFALFVVGCIAEQETVPIGVMVPQTGLAAKTAESTLRGIMLAADQTNVPLNLIVEDDQCDPKLGVTISKKLVEEDAVAAIIGPVCNTVALASATFIEQQGVPRITTGMVLQSTANAGEYHFSFLPEIRHQMRALASYAKREGLTSIAVLALNDELGKESVDDPRQALADEGIDVAGEEYFERSVADFRTPLLKLHQKTPDAIFVMGYVPNMMTVIKQTDELGLQGRLLTWSLFQDNSVLQLGVLAERVVYAYPEDPRPLAVKEGFRERYKKTYGEVPDVYAANGYDTYKLLALAVRDCGKDKGCIRNSLNSIENYEGANGFITVDNRGVGQRAEVTLKTVRNGAFVALER